MIFFLVVVFWIIVVNMLLPKHPYIHINKEECPPHKWETFNGPLRCEKCHKFAKDINNT